MEVYNKLKRILLYFFFAFFIFESIFMYSVLAENTQQYNKIYLNPFYRDSMSSNTNYTYTLNINPSDKIGNVFNAMINFQVYITPSVTYTLWVNDKSCNNPTFIISTTYASAGLGILSFDCSNVITKSGTYKLTLRSDKNSGSSFGWLDLTYGSNLKGDLLLHGTEYYLGQTAKTWLQLRDVNGTAIENGICYVDIYTPDNLEFVERVTMTNMNHDGIYYYDVDTSTMVEGVYPVIARCYYIATQYPNFATSIIMYNGTLDSGSIINTYVEDESYLLTTETSVAFGNPRRYTSELLFENKSCNVDELLLNGITIKWVGRWNSNVGSDVISISIYNYTSNSWMNLFNTITGVGTGVKIVSNSIQTNNLTKSGLVNSSGSRLLLKFNDTLIADATSTGFDYDYVSVLCDSYSNPIWQQVSGSSEIHVNNPQNLSYLNLSCSNNITYIYLENTTTYNNLTNYYFNSTCDFNTTNLNESVSGINESLLNIQGENMVIGIIILFVFGCIALIFNMTKYKKPALQLIISLIFLGLVSAFNNTDMVFFGMISFALFIFGLIMWIVMIRDGKSNINSL